MITIDLQTTLLCVFILLIVGCVLGVELKVWWDRRQKRKKWRRHDAEIAAIGAVDVPIDLEFLVKQVARATCNGMPLTDDEWVGKWKGKFSRPDWKATREELVLRGLLAWRNSRVHSKGVRVLRWRALYYLGNGRPPPPGWIGPHKYMDPARNNAESVDLTGFEGVWEGGGDGRA